MNITFLIGNGFDINCGLKSSYNNMYEDYCEEKETDSEIIKKFKKLIKQNNYETWSDFEWAMARNINKFQLEDDFVECLRDFEEYLIKYLEKEERKFFKRYQTNVTLISKLQNEIKKSIITFYLDINNNITSDIINKLKNSSTRKYNFIVFNYTEVFDRMIGLLDAEKDIIYIHGSLKEKDIVLGVDNENQLELKNFTFSNNGKLSFIKTIFNNEFDSNRVARAKEAIKESDIICVYGMSLGESDLTWRKLIINWINSKKTHLFIYDYKSLKNKNISSKKQQLTEEIKVKEKYITETLKIKNHSESFNKIHIPFKNIFNINEIITKYSNEE